MALITEIANQSKPLAWNEPCNRPIELHILLHCASFRIFSANQLFASSQPMIFLHLLSQWALCIFSTNDLFESFYPTSSLHLLSQWACMLQIHPPPKKKKKKKRKKTKSPAHDWDGCCWFYLPCRFHVKLVVGACDFCKKHIFIGKSCKYCK